MKFAKSLGVIVLALASTAASAADAVSAEVYRSPTCGCCAEYASYLRKNGLTVTVNNVADMGAVHARYGVPEPYQSCHTTIVNGYVVEGHVPVGAINKMLASGKPIKGIAVPGMPQNSPGMGEMKPGTLTVYELPKTTGSKPEVFSVE
jgi:hypothetical protein